METPKKESREHVDVEFFVLGQAINFIDAAKLVVSRLSEEHFSFYHHKKIYFFIKTIVNCRNIISIGLVWEEIKKSNYDSKLDVSYLIQMSQNADISVEIDYYIDYLHEKFTDHQLRDFLDNAYKEIHRYPNRRSPYTLVDQFKESLDSIHSKSFVSRRSFLGKTIFNLLNGNSETPGVLKQIQDRHLYRLKFNKDYINGLPTGYSEIDEQGIILSRGSFVIIAARPAMGKTAFAIDIALHLALQEKKSVGFISLEMPPHQIVERILSNLSGESCERLKRGRFSSETLLKIESISSEIQNSRFFICDNKCSELNSLIDQAKALKESFDIDVLFIDYLQLLETDRRIENRQNEIAQISRKLRALAVELDIPIVCLSQLSRKVEDRGDKRPLLSDLRDSGQIEQDADAILLLYRKDYYSQESTKGLTEVIIGKNRHGAIFSTYLNFDSSTGKFFTQKEAW
uniref:DNA 5'-3' helicase n=1 Tax=Chlamydia pecorum TaxID=85991 RepID=A0A0N9DZ48_9CHLA|nr:DnaB-like helicase C-terminal domain-containing protein [Chlamydia pecorum]ALF35276.1 Replicative DNA helicase [Chlamydia pecorum]ALF35284.1 Replicative DNA helicase [Chlamydia pecorum]ALF35292.1 Replicative DNA helicase [Chlamydia pecorum]